MDLPTFVGLDIETTGLDVSRHKVIQVGIAWWHDNTPASGQITAFTQDVGWKDFEYSPEALKVNGYTPARIYHSPSRYVADTETLGILNHHFPDIDLIPVGWNVGSFDLMFLQQQLPLTASKFGYRSVDMNTLAFHMGVIFSTLPREFKDECKEHCKEVLAKMGFQENWHDAGYDAAAALVSWEYFKKDFAKTRIYQLKPIQGL